ncbi:MAG: hypothetical protein ACHP9Z_19915 [Streptosporangiales bacterium]
MPGLGCYARAGSAAQLPALDGRPALGGLLRAGRFPRDMALEPGGRILLVTCFASGQVEVVHVPGLPWPGPRLTGAR